MGDAIQRAATVLGDRARRDEPLGPRTTYRVGGPAALLFEALDVADLELAREAVLASGVAVLIVGRGSNLLVADAGFPGLAVVLGDGFDAVEVDGPVVRAGGAVSLPVLARRTATAGLTGLEWAVGVPGSVGGAVRMNAGGHGSDVRETLARIGRFDLAAQTAGSGVATVPVSALALAYRHSALRAAEVVVWAEFVLREGELRESEEMIAEVVRWRRDNQPGGSNAGSVFTNPPGDAAGRLVEEAGLKGRRLGSAFVSPKHANFFQADANGSADDVRALILEVQRKVELHSGIRLVPEVRMVGFGADTSSS